MPEAMTRGGVGGAAQEDRGESGVRPFGGSLSLPAPVQGAVRLGARHDASEAAIGFAADPVASEIARLDAELATLKSALARKPAEPARQDERAIEDIRDSIRYLEAYFSVTLPPKLDEIISGKLSVIASAERARTRTRRWLAVSIIANLVLGTGLAAEMQGGSTGRLVAAASSAVESGTRGLSAAVVRGAVRASGIVAAAVD